LTKFSKDDNNPFMKTINLTFKNAGLAKNPKNKKWLQTCEDIINERLEKDRFELLSIGSTSEIYLPSRRLPIH